MDIYSNNSTKQYLAGLTQHICALLGMLSHALLSDTSSVDNTAHDLSDLKSIFTGPSIPKTKFILALLAELEHRKRKAEAAFKARKQSHHFAGAKNYGYSHVFCLATA